MIPTARAVLTAVFVTLVGARAAAASAPIRVTLPACSAPPLPFGAFLESLRVELAGRAPPCCEIGPEEAGPAAGLRVTLALDRCAPDVGAVRVSGQDAATGRSTERRVSLADVPAEVRPRTLALAVAELVRSLEQPEPRRAPAPPPPPPPSAPATPSWQVAAVAAMRVYPSLPTTLWGGKLGLTVAGSRWHAVLDVGAAAGRRELALGSLAVQTVAARLAAGPRFARGHARLDLNAGVELGRASVEGETTIPGVQVGAGHDLVVALGVRVALETPIWRDLRLRAELEGGETLLGFTGDVDGAPAAGVSGPYVSFALGVVVAEWN